MIRPACAALGTTRVKAAAIAPLQARLGMTLMVPERLKTGRAKVRSTVTDVRPTVGDVSKGA